MRAHIAAGLALAIAALPSGCQQGPPPSAPSAPAAAQVSPADSAPAAAVGSPARPSDAPPVDAPVDAMADAPGRALFLKACASCHGADGGGAGSVVLEPPARSFLTGGFSFGNTPEALQRTIGIGIPGTPMPGFGGALSDAELRAVAAFVASLGPPVPHVDESDSVLTVTDAPVVVQGILPPITPEAPLRPRGLLLGMPDGLSFEYRTDDVRLLGVREGGFVRRTDWTGRGGTPLEPLGQVVHLLHGGDPPAPYSAVQVADSAARFGALIPLSCRFLGTWIEGARAGLQYEVSLPAGRAVARVRESARAVRSQVGAGFERRFEITYLRRGAAPAFLLQADEAPRDACVEQFATADAISPTRVWVSRRPAGGFLCTGVRDLTPPASAQRPVTDPRDLAQGLFVQVQAPPRDDGDTVIVCLTTVLASQWSEAQRETLQRELSP